MKDVPRGHTFVGSGEFMEKIIVTQIRSQIGRAPAVRGTLEALGLGSIGKTRELTLNPSVQGMVKKVAHLLKVSSVK